MKVAQLLCISLLLAVLLAGLVTSTHYELDEYDIDEYLDSITSKPTDLSDSESLTAFNLGTSQMYAKLSAAAYCISHKAASVSNWTCNMCKSSGMSLSGTTAYTIGSSGIGFYIGYSKAHNRIIVSFRGSANFANWVANLDFGKTSYPCSGCQVHKGFLNVYQSARATMVSKISALRNSYKSAQVSFTGHSLGGAIAKLAFLDVHQGLFTITTVGGVVHVESSEVGMNQGMAPLPFTQSELQLLGAQQLTVKFPVAKPFYTFGAPRVGNPAFANYFKSSVGAGSLYRSTHRQDPVPKLPSIGMGFAHSTTEVYFPNAGTSTAHQVCSGSNGDDPSCIHKTGIVFSIADHSEYGGIIMTQAKGACN